MSGVGTQQGIKKGAFKKKKKTRLLTAPYVGADARCASVSRRVCPRCTNQWVFMRALLDLAFNERAPGMQSGLFKDKDFTTEQADAMQAFFVESYYFPYMLKYCGTSGRTLTTHRRSAVTHARDPAL